MEICKVRDEYTEDSSSFVIEDCVNKNLDETHRETNMDVTKMVIKKFPRWSWWWREKKTSEKKIGEIHRVLSEKVREIYRNALDEVTIEVPDDKILAKMEKSVNIEDDDEK